MSRLLLIPAALLGLSLAKPSDIDVGYIPELHNARAIVRAEVNAYLPEWFENMPATMMGKGATIKLYTNFGGDLYSMRAYLIRKAPQGHVGWEKEALEAFRGSIFQTPTCAPKAHPGAVGYGVNALRCTYRDPVYRPITNLDQRGLANGEPNETCTQPGDSISMQPGGWVCEVGGDMINVEADSGGFRLIVPEVVGTRGITSFGNGVRPTSGVGDDPFGDSLVIIGRPFVPDGSPGGMRYDHRAASFLTNGAQGYHNYGVSNMIIAHMTTWDEECNGVGGDCTPDEQKPFRCIDDVNQAADSVYIAHMDLHGNSGDDIATLGCGYSTYERIWAGPSQSGGGQTSCLVSGGGGSPTTSITFANIAMWNCGHRTPLTDDRRVEVVNTIVEGYDSRNFEFTGVVCCSELNMRSVLLLPSKVTDTDKRSLWFLFRIHAINNATGLLNSEFLVDSSFFKLRYDKVAADTIPNDGDFTIHAATYTGESVTPRSLWDNEMAICDKTSALGGDVTFPCADSAGRNIDSLSFSADTTLDASSLAASDLSDVFQDLYVEKNVGNRFRWGCDGALLDDDDHNAFLDSMLVLAAAQQLPSSVPGNIPASMQTWYSGYPTASGMAATEVSFTPCPKNANDVPQALADTLVALYGGTADNVDWGWDDASTGYELWRWLIQPDSLDAVLLGGSAGAPSTPDFTFIIEDDTLSVMWLPLDTLYGSLWVDTSLVPLSATPYICAQADPTSNDSALVRVYIGDENSNAVQDSAAVDSIFSNHGPFEGCTLTTLRQVN